MGFSVSATMAIFFAAFLILFSILYSSLNDAFDSVSESFDEKYEYMNDRLDTQVTILDVSYQRDSNTLDIRVQNTGSKVLDISKVDLILEGTIPTSFNKSIQGTDTEVWLPMEVLTITVDDPDVSFEADLDPRASLTNDVSLSAPSNISVGKSVYVLDGPDIDVFTLGSVFDFTITDSANMVSPSDLKVWGDYLYVLDEGTHIDRFGLDGAWVDRIVDDTTNSSVLTSFSVDSDYIYIIDNSSHVDRFGLATGIFVDSIVPNGGTMTSPRDIFVSSHIFVIDYSLGYHVDVYELDGSGGTELIGTVGLSSPTDICASAIGLDDVYVYVVNGSSEVAVFNATGSPVDTVDSLLSDSVSAVDVTGKMYVSDGVNGLVVENLGTNIKVVVENGISCVTVQ